MLLPRIWRRGADSFAPYIWETSFRGSDESKPYLGSKKGVPRFHQDRLRCLLIEIYSLQFSVIVGAYCNTPLLHAVH